MVWNTTIIDFEFTLKVKSVKKKALDDLIKRGHKYLFVQQKNV